MGKIVNNINNKADRAMGDSSEYALQKLRDDAPELHARVISGELSPHAAMIEAGLSLVRTPDS